MRRCLLVLPLLLLAAPAGAAPPRAPDLSPGLVGSPYLFRDGDRMVRLVFRTDRVLPRRFDGLIGGGATIAGRGASLGTVGGTDEATHCYTAATRFRARLGRSYRVRIAVRPDDAAPFELRIALRHGRAGDMRGRPLGC
jgi:hypothetical protein